MQHKMGSAARANGEVSASSLRTTLERQRRYFERRERDVAAIIAAMKRDDFELIARLGHNMRGTAASYGYPELGAIGEQLEAAANQKNIVALAEQLESLGACIARLRAGDP